MTWICAADAPLLIPPTAVSVCPDLAAAACSCRKARLLKFKLISVLDKCRQSRVACRCTPAGKYSSDKVAEGGTYFRDKRVVNKLRNHVG